MCSKVYTRTFSKYLVNENNLTISTKAIYVGRGGIVCALKFEGGGEVTQLA